MQGDESGIYENESNALSQRALLQRKSHTEDVNIEEKLGTRDTGKIVSVGENGADGSQADYDLSQRDNLRQSQGINDSRPLDDKESSVEEEVDSELEGQGELENPRDRFSSDLIDFPVSQNSMKESFLPEQADKSENASRNFETPVKSIERTPEAEPLYYTNIITSTEVDQKVSALEELSQKVAKLIEEIEIFQTQFESNLAIQEFTDEYLRDLIDLTENIDNVIEDLKEVQDHAEDTETRISQGESNRFSAHIRDVLKQIKTLNKNYEETETQFLKFEESRKNVSLVFLHLRIFRESSTISRRNTIQLSCSTRSLLNASLQSEMK